jgi:uncharacterized protein (DUF2237 family)
VLRDDRSSGEGPAACNAGEALEICSIKPMTGFYRDGCCNTGREDIGSHTVCVAMTRVSVLQIAATTFQPRYPSLAFAQTRRSLAPGVWPAGKKLS